jgi:peptidoglycan/LPS O-acetylase OafA/YrhL
MNDVITIAYLVIVVGLAALTWKWIEVPGQHLARLFKPRASGKVVPEAGTE